MTKFTRIILIIGIILIMGIIGSMEIKSNKAGSDFDSINKLQYKIQQSNLKLQSEIK